MRVRPLEIKALVPLLEQDWDSPEELAQELIRTLDQTRASRTSYVGVMQFGGGNGSGLVGTVWYMALGPYPGRASATRALQSDPSASLATKAAVVPVTSPEGLKQRLEEHK